MFLLGNEQESCCALTRECVRNSRLIRWENYGKEGKVRCKRR